MAENKGVVVVGSTNYDLITYTERLAFGKIVDMAG